MGAAGAPNLEQQAIALRDCKAFVALISDAYIADAGCVRLFQYARQNLDKPLIMVVLGSGKEWRQSKIGILVADEVSVWKEEIVGEGRSMVCSVSRESDVS